MAFRDVQELVQMAVGCLLILSCVFHIVCSCPQNSSFDNLLHRLPGFLSELNRQKNVKVICLA